MRRGTGATTAEKKGGMSCTGSNRWSKTIGPGKQVESANSHQLFTRTYVDKISGGTVVRMTRVKLGAVQSCQNQTTDPLFR